LVNSPTSSAEWSATPPDCGGYSPVRRKIAIILEIYIKKNHFEMAVKKNLFFIISGDTSLKGMLTLSPSE
jgi:hypothetical protein